jgi:hypothetical protein
MGVTESVAACGTPLEGYITVERIRMVRSIRKERGCGIIGPCWAITTSGTRIYVLAECLYKRTSPSCSQAQETRRDERCACDVPEFPSESSVRYKGE